MQVIRKVISLLAQRTGYTQIRKETGLSKGMISKISTRLSETQTSFESVQTLTDQKLYSIIYPSEKLIAFLEPDWTEIHHLITEKKLNLLLVYEQYISTPSGKAKHYSYSSFCRIYADWKKTQTPNDTYSNLCHEPGDILEIDFAGDPLHWVDSNSEVHRARLFVACLPFSGMIFARVFENEKQDSWMQGIVEALKYFNGAAKNLVMDNAKALVKHASWHNGEVQQVIIDLCDHYGMVPQTCRPVTPREKNRVEASVNMVEKWVTGRLMLDFKGPVLAPNLEELQSLVIKKVDEVNQRPWRGHYGACRLACFRDIEAQTLLPLPSQAYELGNWKILKVDKGHCIRVRHDGVDHRYSVPVNLTGRKVQVKITTQYVKIYEAESGAFITKHIKGSKEDRSRTHILNEHLTPAEKMARLKPSDWAELLNDMLGVKREVIQGFVNHCFKGSTFVGRRSCNSLMRLRKEFTSEALEFGLTACNQAEVWSNDFLKKQCIAYQLRKGREQEDSNQKEYLTANHDNIRNDYE